MGRTPRDKFLEYLQAIAVECEEQMESAKLDNELAEDSTGQALLRMYQASAKYLMANTILNKYHQLKATPGRKPKAS